MKTSIALGLRAALSRAGRGRLVTLIVVGAIVSACFLIVLAAPTVKAREAERYWRERALESGPSDFGPRATVASYRGRTVTLVQIPSGIDGGRLPPGLASPLMPGEVRMSPALAERVDQDPLLATWFPYERRADLPIDAVSSAGEYKAYIGTAPEDLFVAMGSSDLLGGPYDPKFGYMQWLGFLLFVGVPALGLMAMSSRFGRRVRRERHAALRLLGMSRARCRAVLAIETGLPVAVGATLAVGIAATVHPNHMVIPLVERWVFGEDARLAAVPILLTAGLVTVLGAAIGATTPYQRSATGRLRTLVARADVTRPWTLALYATGVALLVWAWLRAQPRDPLRFVGVLLAGAGIPGAVTYAVGLAGRAVPWTNGPLPWFLAMRKLAADPRSLSRFAGTISIVIFVVGVSQPIVQVITESNSTWVAEAHDAGKASVLGRSRSYITAPLELADRPPPAGTQGVVPEVGLWNVGQASPAQPVNRALIASCTALEDLVAVGVLMCNDTVQYLAQGSYEAEWLRTQYAPTAPDTLEIHSVDGRVIAQVAAPETVPDAVLVLPDETSYLPLPDLIVPPSMLPEDSQPFVTEVYLRTSAEADAWEAAQGWITGSSPFHLLENEFDTRAINDSTGNWIILGFAFAAGIAALGAAFTTLDEQRSAHEWAGLRAVGFTTPGLISIRMIVAATSALVAIAAAVLPGLLATAAFLSVNNDQLESYTPFVTAAVVGTAAVLAISFVSAIIQMRMLARAGGQP